MSKSKTIINLKKQGVIVVVRGNTKEQGLAISKACIAGGIKAIEVAYTNMHASAIISELLEIYNDDDSICIGAGTILDAPTAKSAIAAGANYIVSPSFNQETAVLCNRYNIPYIPGCMTITEIVTAMEMGSELVKLFPGSAFGPGYVKAITSPLPHASLMVTGGVKLDNIDEWFRAGVDAIGIGGEFNTLGTKGEFDKITTIAKQYVEAVAQVRAK